MVRRDRAARGSVESGDGQVVGALESFDVFYRRELPRVLAVVMALTRYRTEAEDVTQEAFVRALRDWDRVGCMSYPGAWVRQVALNLAVSRWRRLRAEARARLRVGRPDDQVAHMADPESVRVWDEVRALPHRQAQVAALSFLDELDTGEIAEVLGVADSTVRVHLARARRTLAERLEDRR